MYFRFVQDLSSLALKQCWVLTTSAGREFQSVIILWLKICPLRLVLCRGLFSFSSWPLVVDSASWKKVSGSIQTILSFWCMILYTCIISPLLHRYSSDGSFRVLSLSMYGCCLKEVIVLVALFCTQNYHMVLLYLACKHDLLKIDRNWYCCNCSLLHVINFFLWHVICLNHIQLLYLMNGFINYIIEQS